MKKSILIFILLILHIGLNAQCPTVNFNSISPTNSSAGWPVTIKGNGFTGVNQIKFNGVIAPVFNVYSDTLVVVTVPQNANSGPITFSYANSCNHQSPINFTYLFSDPKLNVKLVIEGLYVSADSLISNLYNEGLSDNVQHADSLEISLAFADNPNSIFFNCKTLLYTNGTASISMPGNVIGQSFYIILKHRNSIETWSKNPILFTANTYYNFSGVAQFPAISTSSISSISNQNALGGGNITSDGGAAITARGVCWSTTPNPTISLTSKTSDGNGSGLFTSSITGLTANTTYYIRAYATNGVGTAYGNELSFISTNFPSDINGNIYDTVVIGSQVWMKQNLKVANYRNGDLIPTGLSEPQWGALTTGAYAIYNGLAANDSVYGKLYNWYAVADPRGLCPTGWHVPSDAEWTTLENYLGGNSIAGGKLKEIGLTHWASPNIGATNSSGFTGLPGGYRSSIGFYTYVGDAGLWWSTTHSAYSASYRTLHVNFVSLTAGSVGREFGFSVRCLKALPILNTNTVGSILQTSGISGGNITFDGGTPILVRGVCWSTSPNPTIELATKTSNGSGTGIFTSPITGLIPNTTYYVRAYATNSEGTSYGNEVSFSTLAVGQFKDVNGNIYDTIAIGTQVWMKQNLKVANYRNGDPIPTGLTDAQWGAATTGAYTVYGNVATNDAVYGKLYNWYAVVDPRGLCPTGWHVPSDAEWKILEAELGMSANELNLLTWRGTTSNVGGKLKEIGLTHWASPNTGSTNVTGFTGLPGGFRNPLGTYLNIGLYGGWWSSSPSTSTDALARGLYYSYSEIGRGNDAKSIGSSVRCVRD